jgi:hypothetical protein
MTGALFSRSMYPVVDLRVMLHGLENINPVKSVGTIDDCPAQAASDDDLSALECRTPYRAAVGSLLHLARCTRPDISYVISFSRQSTIVN